MAVTQRTATSGTAASGANFTITVPTGTTPLDYLILVVGNAGTAGPATPAGWSVIYSASAGTGQNCAIFGAQYSPSLTLTFTNAASVNAWVCNAYSGINLLDNPFTFTAATNTTNNTTLPTGAPTTGVGTGMYEVLCYVWTSAATISVTASGSTISRTQANGTAVSAAIGFNNTTSLAANTTVTAFSQTLSANNSRKTGVGVLLNPYMGNIQSVGHPFYF